MSKKDKPLPKPPKTPFGRQRPDENAQDEGSLIADRMAVAAAEGRLDEFLKQEMPDNEYARNLASMMMGMTGMMPGGMQPTAQAPAMDKPAAATAKGESDESPVEQEIPEDVKAAIISGNVTELIGLLKREHQMRNPDAAQGTETPAAPVASQPAGALPSIDKELVDAMIEIAKDNSVTLDWMILRAIKVYIQEYKKTGRL